MSDYNHKYGYKYIRLVGRRESGAFLAWHQRSEHRDEPEQTQPSVPISPDESHEAEQHFRRVDCQYPAVPRDYQPVRGFQELRHGVVTWEEERLG